MYKRLGWSSLVATTGLALGGCPSTPDEVAVTVTSGETVAQGVESLPAVLPSAAVLPSEGLDDDLLAAILATIDSDGDGLSDSDELRFGGNPNDPTDGPDIDGDGIPNGDDRDVDGDGVSNESDFDIDGDGVSNGFDSDIDGDGLLNGSDEDIDGDGVANRWDLDMDGDGDANLTDNDADGDGKKKKDDDNDNGKAKRTATDKDTAAMARALAPKINGDAGSVVAKVERLGAVVPGSSQGARTDAVFRQAAEAHAKDVAGVPNKSSPTATVPTAENADKDLDERMGALETLADDLEDEFLLPPPDDYLDDLSTGVSFLADVTDDVQGAADETVDYRKFLAKKLAEEAQRFVNEDRLRSNPNTEAADVIAKLSAAAERTGAALGELRQAAQVLADVTDGVDAAEIDDAVEVVAAAEREEVPLNDVLDALSADADLSDGVDAEEIDAAVAASKQASA